MPRIRSRLQMQRALEKPKPYGTPKRRPERRAPMREVRALVRQVQHSGTGDLWGAYVSVTARVHSRRMRLMVLCATIVLMDRDPIKCPSDHRAAQSELRRAISDPFVREWFVRHAQRKH